MSWDWLPGGPVAWAWAALVLNYVIILVLIPRVIAQRREAQATWAWVFLILLLPYVGVFAFWAVGSTHLRMRRWRRRMRQTGRLPALADLSHPPHEAEQTVCPLDHGLLELTRRLEGTDPSPGNAVELFWEGPQIFDTLEAGIDAAEHHVHLQFYIWWTDDTSRRLRDALVRAAKRDVEVRLLLDDHGTRNTPRRFFRDLILAGGKVSRFLPVSFFSRRLSINNRNHRKIVVVDGKLGFTGGINVGDEYAGIDPDQPWLDVMVRLEGPAVLGLQETFCQDWFRTTNEDLAKRAYFPLIGFPGNQWVQVLDSGPDEEYWHAIHTLLVTAISQARDRVWIASPYFIPDKAIALALVAAALRGVDVRLLLPGEHTDQVAVRYAGRSFYSRQLAAGVKVWEFRDAFMHAKVVVVDECFATVGSANLDERSMGLNFETNAFFYSPATIASVVGSFLELQAKSDAIDPKVFAGRPRRDRVREAVWRLFAPIL